MYNVVSCNSGETIALLRALWDLVNAKGIYAIWPGMPLLIFKTASEYHSDFTKDYSFSLLSISFFNFPIQKYKGKLYDCIVFNGF